MRLHNPSTNFTIIDKAYVIDNIKDGTHVYGTILGDATENLGQVMSHDPYKSRLAGGLSRVRVVYHLGHGDQSIYSKTFHKIKAPTLLDIS